MSVALQVVLLIVGIVAVLALIAVPIVLGYRRKYRAAAQAAAADLQAEGVLRAFEKGVYRGASAPGFPAVKNNGRIALTRRRVVFVTLTGTTIDISTMLWPRSPRSLPRASLRTSAGTWKPRAPGIRGLEARRQGIRRRSRLTGPAPCASSSTG